MKKLILLILFLFPLLASAQAGQFIPFIRWTNATGTNSTTTAFAISGIASGNCLQTSTGGAVISAGSACGSGNFAWPFTKQVGGEQATSTIISFLAGLTSASSTFTGDLTIVPLTSALLQTGAGGLLAEYAGTSCTNQFPRSLSALGIATCATVANTDLANSTISGVALGSNLNNLTNGATLNGSAYNGSAAISDWDINLGNANDWTALQTFTNATSTLFSSTIASTSQLILSGASDGCLNVSGGNVSSTGVACGSGGGLPWPFTKQVGGEQATSTIMEWVGGYLSNASSTHTGSTTLATTLITNATSTNLHVSNLASTTNLRANTALLGNVGVATTAPLANLSIEQGTEAASLIISNSGSSTPSLSINGVNGNGYVGIGTSSPRQKLTISQTDSFSPYTLGELVGQVGSTVYGTAELTADNPAARTVGAFIGEGFLNMTVTPAAAIAMKGFNGVGTVRATDTVQYPASSVLAGGGLFAEYNGTGSIPRVAGGTIDVIRLGAGTTTQLHGLYFSPITNLSGTKTTDWVSGITINRPASAAGATWSTTTGLWIANQTPAAGTLTTTAFGVYQEGNSNRNHFGGTVGVNVITAGSRLHTKGGTNDALLVEDDSGLCEAQPTTTGLTWSCSSDERLKTDIVPTTFKALDYLDSIPLFDYTVIKTGERVVGPVAQRLIASHPELVTLATSTEKSEQTFGEENEQYQVSEPTTWQIVKAIQEMWNKVIGHESRIEQLERENTLLKARLDALEARLTRE